MNEIDFYILDVFAKHKYGGNQLAVYLDLEDKLSSSEMHNMAKEINFAESTFIKKAEGENIFSVKIFTTESEIPFAGHPTIGTAYIIAKYLFDTPPREIVLRLMQGDIKVTLSSPDDLDNCLLTMTQTQPQFLKTFKPEDLSKGLNLEPLSIADDAVIQEISTGLPTVIIPINDLESMDRISLTTGAVRSFLIDNQLHRSNSPLGLSSNLFFYTTQTYETENDYNTRMFCLENDVLVEDAATGSANGCFLAYLLKHKHAQMNAKVEQGFQMKRKSYLLLEGTFIDGHYDIKVGGTCRMISKGKWIL